MCMLLRSLTEVSSHTTPVSGSYCSLAMHGKSSGHKAYMCERHAFYWITATSSSRHLCISNRCCNLCSQDTEMRHLR